MLHGLDNNFLYAAKKITTKCSDGTQDAYFRGTGFFISKDSDNFFITNRHVVDPDYNKAKYKNFYLVEFCIESFKDFDSYGRPCNINTTSIASKIRSALTDLPS